MPCPIESAVADFLDLHHRAEREVVVAYSGGMDSTVLLHALAAHRVRTPFKLSAVHIDHQLQATSSAWAQHCSACSARLQVPLQVLKVAVVEVAQYGPEGAARRARHAAFASALAQGDLLLTAHHADDQAETFLLRAFRSAGVEGLASMQPLRVFGNARMGRPFLQLPRSALHDYALSHQLEWIEDPTNALADADRNFLRLQVLPLIAQRWPQARRALAQSAQLVGAALPSIRRALDSALAQTLDNAPDRLHIDSLLALDADTITALLRHWLIGLRLTPAPPRVLDDLLRQLRHAAKDRNLHVQWPGAELRRYRGALHASQPLPPAPAFALTWNSRDSLRLPSGQTLRIDGDSVPTRALMVRSRAGGESLRIAANGSTRDLRLLFQEVGVPPWQRERLPYIWSENELVAVGDQFLDHRFRSWLHEHDARLIHDPPQTELNDHDRTNDPA